MPEAQGPESPEAPKKKLTWGGARPGSGQRKKTAAELKAHGASPYKVARRKAEEEGISTKEALAELREKPLPPTIEIGETAITFAHEVKNGKIIAGELERQACERFIKDLERDDLMFDTTAAQEVGEYARQARMELLDWECFVLANLFGWRRLNGKRRFNFAYVELGRKNGKTGLMALVIVYMADPEGDGEPDAQCYIAATTRYQSRDLLFKACKDLCEKWKKLNARSESFATTIVFSESGRIEATASKADKLAGFNIHCGVLDEVGDHPNADLLNVFKSGTVGRPQPMTLCITTAGQQRDGNVAWDQRQFALQVLDGSVQDDTTFAFICCPDKDDPWDSETAFRKANPSYGVLVDAEQMRGQCEKARASMTAQIAFKRFNLNIWPETAYVNSWFPFSAFSKPGVAYLPGGEKLKAQERITTRLEFLMREGTLSKGGLDLGLVSDLSVLAMVFQQAEDRYEVIARKFMPAKCELAQREPFRSWIAEGWIETTPDAFTDFRFIEEAIHWMREHVAMTELCFDKALAPDLVTRLADYGLPIVEIRQGYSLSPAILRVEKLIKESKLCLHGDPVLAWCFSNVVLETGASGDYRFTRNKSRDKIDAAVATTIAMAGWLHDPQLPYTGDRGVVTI